MIVAEPKNLRIVIPPGLQEEWRRLTDGKKISQQDAVEALIRFVLGQSDVGRSLVLGQIQPSPQLLKIVFGELTPSGPARVGSSAERGHKKGDPPRLGQLPPPKQLQADQRPDGARSK